MSNTRPISWPLWLSDRGPVYCPIRSDACFRRACNEGIMFCEERNALALVPKEPPSNRNEQEKP